MTSKHSYTVVRIVHGIPVQYLTIDKAGFRWVKDSAKAYRFTTATGATHYMMTTCDGDTPFQIVEVPSLPTSEQHPNNWTHRTKTPPPKPHPAPHVPLEPWKMTTTQRIMVTVGLCFGSLMAVALVAGW